MSFGPWRWISACCPEAQLLLDHTAAGSELALTAAIGRDSVGIWDTFKTLPQIPGSTPAHGLRYLMGWVVGGPANLAGGAGQTVVLEFLELGSSGATSFVAGNPPESILVNGFESDPVPFCFPIRGRGVELRIANNTAAAAQLGLLLLGTADPSVAAQWLTSDRWTEKTLPGLSVPHALGIGATDTSRVVWTSARGSSVIGGAATTAQGLMQVHSSGLAYSLLMSEASLGALLILEAADTPSMANAVAFHQRSVPLAGIYSSSEEDVSTLSATAGVRASGATLRPPEAFWRARLVNGDVAQTATQLLLIAGGPPA